MVLYGRTGLIRRGNGPAIRAALQGPPRRGDGIPLAFDIFLLSL